MTAIACGSPPSKLRWTCALFHDLCDHGLMEGRNVILVNGEIIEMPPPNPAHNVGLMLADQVLRAIFTPGYAVRNQMALDVDLDTDPVPDLAFVEGSPRDYAKRQAVTAALIVEVSDTTFTYDKSGVVRGWRHQGLLDSACGESQTPDLS